VKQPVTALALERRIIDLLIGGFTYLANNASQTGHWGEVRSTSLAGMCLQLREPGGSKWLTAVREWLFSQQITHDSSSGSWGEEVWDSAMCLLALRELDVPSTESRLNAGIGWVGRLFSANGRGNWHDEPWETSWALIALLRIGRIPEQVDIARAMHWLASLQNPEGRIISSSYSAYFVLIEHWARASGEVEPDAFRSVATKAAQYLKQDWRDSSPDSLWGGEAWLNGQVLWALGHAEQIDVTELGLLDKTIQWFERNQDPEGNWSDVEDTASAILGLHRLLWALMRQRLGDDRSDRELNEVLENRIRKAVPMPLLRLKRRLIERDPELGYLSVNVRESTVRVVIGAVVFLSVGLVGWLADVIALVHELLP